MRGVSLRGRLTVLVVLILLGGVLSSGLLAYRSARREAVSAAFARQLSAASRLAGTVAPGLSNVQASLDSLARRPSLAASITKSEPTDEVRRLLAPLRPDGRAVAAVELRSLDGRVIVALGDAPADHGPTPLSTGIGPLFTSSGRLYFELKAPVRSGDAIVGHLVQVRRVAGTQAGVDLLTGLIGPDATLLLGNADGSIWTDLATLVDRPRPSFQGTTYTRDGLRRVAASAPIGGTPLVFSVEVPEHRALASVRSLFRGDVVVATTVVLIGALVAWWMAGTLAAPVTALTSAAEVVTRGESIQAPLPTNRGDEIGRLARAFEVMEQRVREARETLEHRVAERTTELNVALDELQVAQEELVRRERLATLGQLSSSVGHELRNPLGVMTNAVYYLTATQPDASPKTKEYLGVIRTQIQMAEKIVADLLDFARVRPPQRSTVQLPAFMDEQLERVPSKPGVTVVRELPSDLPTVRIDPLQIGQVVLNLVTNAVQAMEEAGGVLTIAARRESGRVRVEFADTGPGIAETNLPKVFEPLFTTKARGIGLGLSVSRSLSQANGGDLTVRNQPGAGAVFTLDLPVEAPA